MAGGQIGWRFSLFPYVWQTPVGEDKALSQTIFVYSPFNGVVLYDRNIQIKSWMVFFSGSIITNEENEKIVLLEGTEGLNIENIFDKENLEMVNSETGDLVENYDVTKAESATIQVLWLNYIS